VIYMTTEGIRDAEQARDILERGSLACGHLGCACIVKARVYLAALEGVEVKALMDGLVWVNGNISKRMATAEIQYVRDRIDGYLANFKKAVGK
jgi:hypothetical protein